MNSVVNELAVRMGGDLAAAVPFYGTQPSAADAAKIKAPILAHYGELDTRITSGWPAFDAALTAVLSEGKHVTRDLGGDAGTKRMTEAIVEKLKQ